LFRKSDLAAIREEVSGMTAKQLLAWLEKTREIRQIMEGDDWQQINECLGTMPGGEASTAD
jgi:hypothetical protein